MSVQSYDILQQSNDSRTLTYDLTMIAWWEAESWVNRLASYDSRNIVER